MIHHQTKAQSSQREVARQRIFAAVNDLAPSQIGPLLAQAMTNAGYSADVIESIGNEIGRHGHMAARGDIQSN